jgi:protein SCO1/2
MTNLLNARLRRSLRKFAAVAFLGIALCLGGCKRADEATSSGREFPVRGAVRGISPDGQTLEIEHEAIPDFMPAMTMPFNVKDGAAAKDVKIGDAVSFRMLVTDKEAVIDRIQKIDRRELELPPSTVATKPATAQSARLRPGDMVPPFRLINERGEPLDAQTLRGQPFIMTFIFTRCPIPNFCPLMNRNFGELQNAIKSGTGSPAKTRLLSISFDPEFDTPAVLKQTAESERADPAIWSFATGEPEQIKQLTSGFSVRVEPEGGSIAHGLATALVDGEGRIVEIWRGNGWTPQEVLAKLADLPPKRG